MTSRRLKALLVLSLVIAAGTAPAAIAATTSAPRAKISDYFTPLDLDRSKRYRGPLYALAFAGMAVTIAAGGAVGLGRGSRWLGRWVSSGAGGRWWLETIILAAVVTIVTTVASLPFGYGRYLHDRHWELSTQSPAGYLTDMAKGTAFQFVLTAVAALAFFGIVRALPRHWPAVAAAFGVGLTVLLVYVLPVIYEPLFNKFSPVSPEVRQRVLSIADKAGVKVGDVLVADASRRTTRQNAYVSGLGATKRVVLYDTLLERSSPEQIDLVVAHELSHVAHKDVLKGTALGALGAVLAVLLLWRLFEWPALGDWIGIAGPGDPRALPFVAFVLAVTTLVSLPVVNAYSRRIEAAADRSAIEITRDPRTAIQVEISLARSNLSDLEPNRAIYWVFFTHPSTLERIQIALDRQGAHAGG
jgi:STE24 endopeptidase